MSYKAITREDTVWAGDYVGCGVGLGSFYGQAQPMPAPFNTPEATAMVTGTKIPVPPGGGGTTGVLPQQPIKNMVQVPSGWRTVESYKGWAIQAMPNPQYQCPPGAMCKLTPDIYRAVQGVVVSATSPDKATVMRWVDVQAARPPASGPVTIRQSPSAPQPSVPHQQLVVGGGKPSPGDILVPTGARQVPKVVTQSPVPPPAPAPQGKGKGLLTAAGIAAAAYMLLG